MKENLTIKDIDRIIEMAWEDRTPFEAITFSLEFLKLKPSLL